MDHEKAQVVRESYLACMICGSNERLRVDHCHSTGKIRGRLCDNCNKGVGLFKDSPFFLKRAADYLENA